VSDHIHVARRRLLTTRQTARKLNIHESTLALWCEHGLIKPYDLQASTGSRFAELDVIALRNRLSKDARWPETEVMQTG
jgi:hypothetical protein